MIDRKEFETYTESHNIPEVFSFSEKEKAHKEMAKQQEESKDAEIVNELK